VVDVKIEEIECVAQRSIRQMGRQKEVKKEVCVIDEDALILIHNYYLQKSNKSSLVE